MQLDRRASGTEELMIKIWDQLKERTRKINTHPHIHIYTDTSKVTFFSCNDKGVFTS